MVLMQIKMLMLVLTLVGGVDAVVGVGLSENPLAALWAREEFYWALPTAFY